MKIDFEARKILIRAFIKEYERRPNSNLDNERALYQKMRYIVKRDSVFAEEVRESLTSFKKEKIAMPTPSDGSLKIGLLLLNNGGGCGFL